MSSFLSFFLQLKQFFISVAAIVGVVVAVVISVVSHVFVRTPPASPIRGSLLQQQQQQCAWRSLVAAWHTSTRWLPISLFSHSDSYGNKPRDACKIYEDGVFIVEWVNFAETSRLNVHEWCAHNGNSSSVILSWVNNDHCPIPWINFQRHPLTGDNNAGVALFWLQTPNETRLVRKLIYRESRLIFANKVNDPFCSWLFTCVLLTHSTSQCCEFVLYQWSMKCSVFMHSQLYSMTQWIHFIKWSLIMIGLLPPSQR